MKFKVLLANVIWKLAGISPVMGNLVLDILGEKLYDKIARLQTIN